MKRVIRRHRARVHRRYAPVEAEHVVTSRRNCREGLKRVDTLGEENERDCWEAMLREARADGRGYMPERREREFRKVVRGKLPCPRLEHLQELRRR